MPIGSEAKCERLSFRARIELVAIYKITREALLTLEAEGDARVPESIRAKITTLLIDATPDANQSDVSSSYPTVDVDLIKPSEN